MKDEGEASEKKPRNKGGIQPAGVTGGSGGVVGAKALLTWVYPKTTGEKLDIKCRSLKSFLLQMEQGNSTVGKTGDAQTSRL